jgi:DNA-binding transcriptional LysR family regulator
VLAVRRDDPLAAHASVAFARLRDHPVITLMRGSGLRAVLEDAPGRAEFTPRISAEASELASLVELAAQGLGVALLPCSGVGEAGPASRSSKGHRPTLGISEVIVRREPHNLTPERSRIRPQHRPTTLVVEPTRASAPLEVRDHQEITRVAG